MAQVFPFRALRYNPERVRLAQVVTQPYDKISPAMQARYYDASPHNLVRIILGRAQPGDDDGHNVYTRAAASFQDWRQQGVLLPDAEPAVYRYVQHFAMPGEPGRVLERRGFIALGRLEDYDRGVVFRHEQTLSAPKTDRLNLLRSTRAHFGQLFMLYSDPACALDPLLQPASDPDMDVGDEYGVQHRVWRLSDPALIQRTQKFMADKKLIIADGHHRYETALNYRDECRRASAETPLAASPSAPCEHVMMTFVNLDAPGLVILPTHRVVHGLRDFQSGEFVRRARDFFAFEQIPDGPDGYTLLRQIADRRASETVLAAVTRQGAWLLRTKPGAAERLLSGLSLRQQQLDVVQLHRVLLEHVLGISPQAIVQQQNVTYVRDAQEAAQRVRAGEADIAFLMNPVGIEQVRDIALAGEVLPQKSTDFYPKLLSGLTIYALD